MEYLNYNIKKKKILTEIKNRQFFFGYNSKIINNTEKKTILKNNISHEKVYDNINISHEKVYDNIKIEKYIFEKVYIISLKKSNVKRDRCINQLLKYNIENYEFVDSWKPQSA